MILFIDTSDFNDLRLALLDSKTKRLTQTTNSVAYNENYKTALFLEKFLQANKVKPHQLTKIFVCSGPGSFTGIRVGVALAEAFAMALAIPVLAIKKSQVPQDLTKLTILKVPKHLSLNYGAKPNITKAKVRR